MRGDVTAPAMGQVFADENEALRAQLFNAKARAAALENTNKTLRRHLRDAEDALFEAEAEAETWRERYQNYKTNVFGRRKDATMSFAAGCPAPEVSTTAMANEGESINGAVVTLKIKGTGIHLAPQDSSAVFLGNALGILHITFPNGTEHLHRLEVLGGDMRVIQVPPKGEATPSTSPEGV